MFATPAMASLIVQNYMEADVSVADACFSKAPGRDPITYTGSDADNPLAGFNDTNNTVQVSGANLLEEKLTIRGMRGDRVMYTDVVRYQNTCDVPLKVSLIADGTTATGDWDDRSAQIYISTVGAPGSLPGDPSSTDWDNQPIIVTANSAAISAPNNRTGTVTIPAGGEVRGAVVIAAGVDATNGIGTVNWIATASHDNGQ
ncbi:MAG: hypothetical protein R2706_14840 [Acidimicrobiales bacterium]